MAISYDIFPPQQAVWGLLVGWVVWLAVVSACILGLTPAVIPEVVVGTSMVPLLVFVGLSVYYQEDSETKDSTTFSSEPGQEEPDGGTIASSLKTRREETKTRTSAYSYNLANTALTVVAATVGFPVLYSLAWYPDRVRNSIELCEDIVDDMAFPSVALLQRTGWASEAILGDAQGQCFIGWPDDSAPNCVEFAGTSTACNCADGWAKDIVDFDWHNNSYRVLALQSHQQLKSDMPTTQMVTHTQFFFNSSRVNQSIFTFTPTIWIAIYDPGLTLREALEYGYTRMFPINANGMTAVSLGLHYREAPGKPSAYDYGVSFSTIPIPETKCDVALRPDAPPCTLTLLLQYPTFDRQVSRQSIVLSAGGLVTEAGAWFALFQLAGWLLSGLAIQPK